MNFDKLLQNKTEGRLFVIGVIFSSLIWIAFLFIGFFFLLIFWIASLFIRSVLIAHVKGNGVKITPEQFPDLYEQIHACALKTRMDQPEAYLLNQNGLFNAFAAHFLKSKFIILLAPIVESLENKPNAIRFYIGHELGHLKENHAFKRVLLCPFLWIPIVGQAYLRACEYTCDLYGLYCANSLEDSQYALAVLASGGNRWQKINIAAFSNQTQETGKFWMAIHELTSSYPWLCKRCAYLEAKITGKKPNFPTRNFFAGLLAAFVPNFSRSNALNMLVIFYIAFLIIFISLGKHSIEAKKISSVNSVTQTNNLVKS